MDYPDHHISMSDFIQMNEAVRKVPGTFVFNYEYQELFLID